MSWKDKLEAQGRGAAQTLTGGWNDELVAKILQELPMPDDKTGIPREYAGGQYEQYRDQQRADEAASQASYPGNFASGQILGAVPGTVATIATGGLPAVGLAAAQGAASGAGLSTAASGKELAKDAVRGGAVGGALASAGNAAQAAAPALKALWRQGPPPPMAPAMAGAGGGAARARPAAPMRGPQVNMSEGPIDFGRAKALRGAGKTETEKLAALEDAFAEGKISQAEFLKKEAEITGGGAPTSEAEMLKTAEASRKALEPGKVTPTQPDLPGIPEPQYMHHATPVENAQGIAELGYRPQFGGKNYNFKKNQGRTYFSKPEDADRWNADIGDMGGNERNKVLETRTTAPTIEHNPQIFYRTEPVPPELIQYKNQTGDWRPVKELRPADPDLAMDALRQRLSPNQNWLPHVPTTEEWDFSKYLNQR